MGGHGGDRDWGKLRSGLAFAIDDNVVKEPTCHKDGSFFLSKGNPAVKPIYPYSACVAIFSLEAFVSRVVLLG